MNSGFLVQMPEKRFHHSKELETSVLCRAAFQDNRLQRSEQLTPAPHPEPHDLKRPGPDIRRVVKQIRGF